MWRARPISWLTREYAVEKEGRPLARVVLGGWGARARIEFGDERLGILREGFWRPKFHLERAGERLATARADTAFWSGFTIAHGGEEYRFVHGWSGRSWGLSLRGRRLGQIRWRGFFARNFELELDDGLAPELGLFAFWLYMLVMRRGALPATAGKT